MKVVLLLVSGALLILLWEVLKIALTMFIEEVIKKNKP